MTELIQTSSLEKILPQSKCYAKQLNSLTVLHGEEGAYQIAFKERHKTKIKVNIKSDIKEYVSVRLVGCVPVMLPTYEEAFDDPDYISKEPGLFPDVLMNIYEGEFESNGWYQALWVSVDANVPKGEHKIEIEFASEEETKRCEMIYNVLNVDLPESDLIFTQWFHSDCIATYYNVDVWSERHWDLIEKFLRTAVKNGINMILTPLFTPPLDTEVGGERPTVQLVGITKNKDRYTFDFSLLERWVKLCMECGVKYFEIAHLFTQWGAEYTPKIMAVEDGEEKRIFGWDVRADDPEYEIFLSQFLPQIVEFFNKKGLLENTYFHISDEPREIQIESYTKSRDIALKYLEGCKVIDALSDYDFFEKGVVERPIASLNHIEPFIGNVEELWGYYCCSQSRNVSNRMIAMPSARTRYIAMQMYKYRMKGFLQWGYNFYYTQYSKKKINPFFETDSGGAFPAGDPFSVYPGEEGPLESLRLKVFYHALQDLTAMRLLERYIGYKETLKIIEDEAGNIVFSKCTSDPELILKIRNRINDKLAECVKG